MMRNFLAAALLLFSLGGCAGKNGGLTGSGTIEADVIRLSSQLAGTVVGVFVSEGERVDEGRLLAKIDDGLLVIQLRQAESGVRLAENQLDLLRKGAREEDVRQAEAYLKRAEENLKTAREDRERMRALFKTGSVTQKQRDDAETRLALAETEYHSAQEGVKKIRNLARPEEIEAARIRVEQARAARDLLAKQREYTEIRAPRTGTILTKTVVGGEFAVPGSVLFTLADLDELSLVVYVPESDLGKIVLGAGAEVFVDSHPGRAFPAETVHIAQEAEFTPRNVQTREERVKLVYAVKLKVKNPEGILKIGMPADAILQGRE